MLHRAFACLWFPIIHVLTNFINIFIKRDDRILLFGSRGGGNFGGNPRYLFQYLSENKDKYNLLHVIWATRNKEVYQELKSMGYEVYMMKSWKSFYYHIKAGYYFCNVNVATGDIPQKIKGDLMGELSAGAVTVQLLHSIANIKGNRLVGTGKQNPIIKLLKNVNFWMNRNYILQKYFLYPGNWSSMIFFEKQSSMTDATESHIYNGRQNNKKCNRIQRVSIGFPELCPCIRYTSDEQVIISKIDKGKRIILYVPTYRDKGNQTYIHPLKSMALRKYIIENDYLWIDKAHPNGNQNEDIAEVFDEINFFKLPPKFDVNILIPQIDLMITDYSSIMLKAVYFKKALINYVPDLEEYAKNERGFLEDFDSFFMGRRCFKSEEIMKAITDQLGEKNGVIKYNDSYENLINKYFDGIISSYENIAEFLLNEKI